MVKYTVLQESRQIFAKQIKNHSSDKEEKLELLKDKTLKNAEIKFNSIYRYALLTPISALIIVDFLNKQLVLFDSKYAGQNKMKTLILNKEDK